ncbi:MAG: 30S ribosomal protein S1 [Phycisphaerae bacterium]|nr:30S ribosomal protein S1 [Phycisphaerae bacterium]
MIDEALIRSLGLVDADVDAMLKDVLGGRTGQGSMESFLGKQAEALVPGKLITGKVIGFAGNDVLVEVGLKSEGLIAKEEFEGVEPKVGEEITVLLERLEGDGGLVQLSKRKADRMLNWQRIMDTTREGDVVEGLVTRKIKGGLLVDIGVQVFLPASQVDVRRPADIGEYMGRRIRATILKIDTDTRNIVISRRKLIEEERAAAKKRLMETLKEGDLVTGEVKNIADFGAFIDLGGIDGLLHITDMSWSRINHPSELVKIGQRVEVKVLNIDREKEKIALGLKQKEASPWSDLEKKYPINSRVRGTVVNVVPYGAFVRLEDGIEGLVHISEMSWTRRINHPSEVLQPGQEVDVVVLDINKDKKEISLGMKQTEINPWELVGEKYPVGSVIEGKVRNLTNYGAFVEIEPGIDGLLHVSDMSWTKKITHANEVLKKNDSVKCVILEVDRDKQRISLGIKQLTEDPWISAIPEHYKPGMVVRGKVTKITNFGVFVELEQDLEGLLHISELADHKVENPQDVVKAGDEIDVKILRVDRSDRKIGLSLKRAQWGETRDVGSGASDRSYSGGPSPTRGGMDDHDAMGTDKIRLR